MKTMDFMDKQITQLSGSEHLVSSSTFFHSDEEEEEASDDEFYYRRGYSFDRNRPLRSSISQPSVHGNCSSADHMDSVKVGDEQVGMPLVCEIDRKMKEHFDNLLRSVDSFSTRVFQLENKTRQIENAVDNLKVSTEYSNGRTDGRLRQLESTLREIQDGIYFIMDKQDIAEVKLQLAKLQNLKLTRPSEDKKPELQANSLQQASSLARKQSPQPLPTAVTLPPNPTPEPYIPTLSYQNLVPPKQPMAPPQFYQHVPNLPQISQSPQHPQVHSPLGSVDSQKQPHWTHHPEETPHLPSHICQPSPLFGPPVQQFYSDLPQEAHIQPVKRPNLELLSGPGPTNLRNLPPHRGPLAHYDSPIMTPLQSSLPEETPYLSSPIYQPNPLIGPPAQQFYSNSSQERHGRPNLELPVGSGPGIANLGIMHPHREPSAHYGSPITTPSQSFLPGGGSDYTQLPKADILSRALPTASFVDDGSSSSGVGSRVSVDDVIDKVTSMGFRRDLVRANVKKLMKNGQSVDLNVVLDLMNYNGDADSHRGQLGR